MFWWEQQILIFCRDIYPWMMKFWKNGKRFKIFAHLLVVFETLILCRCLTHAYYIEFLEWTKNDLNHKYKTEITISLLFFHTMCPYAIKENYVVILLLIIAFNFTYRFLFLEKPFYLGDLFIVTHFLLKKYPICYGSPFQIC